MALGGYSRDLNLATPAIQGGGASAANYAPASNNVSVTAPFQVQRETAWRPDKQAEQQLGYMSAERRAGMQAESQMRSHGAQAIGQAAAAYNQRKGYEAMASAQKSGAAMSAIGGVLKAGIGLMSDERCKQQIESLGDCLEKLKQLTPVTYKYKPEYAIADPERVFHGFIAQDLAKVLPGAVVTDGDSGLLCIDPVQVIPLLVKSVQQLSHRIEELESAQHCCAAS